MSYDMSINDETDYNYTWNVSEMWYDCYKDNGIREHYGMTGTDSLPVLRKLRNHMEDNMERLKEMEPSNGWGTFTGALNFVNRLITAAIENPDGVWEGD